jgi:hypothetical protein
MAMRSTASSVTFAHPFALKGVAGQQAAGTYEVETEEEIIETLHRTVYVRVATLLIIRSVGMTRTVTVDPHDLEAALARDRAMAG